MKKALFLLLIGCFAVNVQAQTITVSSLETGDFVFLNLDCGPLCNAIESVTPDYKRPLKYHRSEGVPLLRRE